MQATNVKQVLKPQLVNSAAQQVAVKQSEKLEVKTAKLVELKIVELKVVEASKAPSFHRALEAYGDCV